MLLMQAASFEERQLPDSAGNIYELLTNVDPRIHVFNAYGWHILANDAWNNIDRLLYMRDDLIRDSSTLTENLTGIYQKYRLFADRDPFDTTRTHPYLRMIEQQAPAIMEKENKDPYLGSLLISTFHHLADVHPLKERLRKDSAGFVSQHRYLQKALVLYDAFGEANLDTFGVWLTGKHEVALDMALLNSEQTDNSDRALQYFREAFDLKRSILAKHPTWE